MAGNEAQVVGAELERVLPKVPTLFERDDVFYSAIEKRPVETISARDMRAPVELRPGGYSGYFDPDGGNLGRGDSITYDKALINCAFFKHAVELTSKQIWATDNNRKAVVNAFRDNLAKAMKEFRRNVDAQAMGNGTGVLGTISAVSTSGGVDTYTMAYDGFRAKLPRYGMKVNVFNYNLTTCRTSGGPQNEVKVTLYDVANNQIQVTPAVSGATGNTSGTGDLIVASGLQNTPPIGLLGIQYHNNSSSVGVWEGFDRSITPEIRANSVNANSAALTLPLPRLAMNKIGDRLGMNVKKNLTAWTHPAQEQAYEELGFLVSQINKEAKQEGLDLYFDTMRMAGVKIKCSYLWDRTRIDFIDLDVMGRAEMTPPGFYTNPDNGQKVWETRGGDGGVSTSWIFYITAGFNIFCTNPAALSAITALAVPSGY